MAVNAEQVTNQIVTFARALTLRQKITMAVGAAAVAGTIWVFVTLLDKADYKTLYSGLSAGDAQSLSQRLAEKISPMSWRATGPASASPPTNSTKSVSIWLRKGCRSPAGWGLSFSTSRIGRAATLRKR